MTSIPTQLGACKGTSKGQGERVGCTHDGVIILGLFGSLVRTTP